MIFFNIAWMDYYKGDLTNDCPSSTHKFIKDEQWGGEILNFKPFNERMYGYVEAGFRRAPRFVEYQIHIERIGASPYQQFIDDVTIIWVARHKYYLGTFIVGWYNNARLYRKRQPPPPGSGRDVIGNCGDFFATALASNCRLVPASSRNFKVPRRSGGFGRSNVWYADNAIGIKCKGIVVQYMQEWQQKRS